MTTEHTPVVPGSLLSRPKWDIWSEGYRATGESGGALRLARAVPGKTFEDAVHRAFEQEPESEKRLWDLDRMTYWGCRLFSTEEEARRSYG